jgi:hypothetical protein
LRRLLGAAVGDLLMLVIGSPRESTLLKINPAESER